MNLELIKKGTPLLVRWFDAFSETDSYDSFDDIADDRVTILKDIGFFIKKTNTYLVLANEISPFDEDGYDGHVYIKCCTFIPIVNILEIETLNKEHYGN